MWYCLACRCRRRCRCLLDQMTIIYILLVSVWPGAASAVDSFIRTEKERKKARYGKKRLTVTDYGIDRVKMKAFFFIQIVVVHSVWATIIFWCLRFNIYRARVFFSEFIVFVYAKLKLGLRIVERAQWVCQGAYSISNWIMMIFSIILWNAHTKKKTKQSNEGEKKNNDRKAHQSNAGQEKNVNLLAIQ